MERTKKWRLLSTKRAVSVDRMAQSMRSEPIGVARAAYFVPATRSWCHFLTISAQAVSKICSLEFYVDPSFHGIEAFSC